MPMTEVDRDFIFLLLAGTESGRALRAFDEVERLVGVREQIQPGAERREIQAVFDQIRLALHFSSSVSKIFWPPRGKASARGKRLRTLAGIPCDHFLKDRSLRDHIEHMDERLDDWTKKSPRPFLSTEMILYPGFPDHESRQEVITASAIVFDSVSCEVILFGHVFCLRKIRAAVLDVQCKCSATLVKSMPG